MPSHGRLCFFAGAALIMSAGCQTNRITQSGDGSWAAVSPASAVLRAIGASVQLNVVNALGAPVTVPGLTWRSLESQIVQVDGNGRATAMSPGTARIVVETTEQADTATIQVVQDVATVSVTPGTPTIGVGGTQQLTASLLDPNGHAVSGRAVTWASGNTGIATVNGGGVVTGVSAGSTAITATSGGTSGSATVTVTGGPPPPPDATPPSTPQNLTAVAAGATQVNLSWSASTDNVGVTGYRVFRNGGQVGAPTGTSFQDDGVSASTTYSYTVAAVDAAGNVSPQSSPATATTSSTSTGGALPVRLAQSTGAVFYVAPNGSNTNAGTIDAPWQTIQKALNTLQPGQKAYVRAGTYREALTMSRAGTVAAAITIEAYPGEQPIIDAELVRRPLVIQSSGAYFRIKGFILDRDCCTSGGHIDVYGHHIEIIDNEMRNGKGKGVYVDEQSHHVHIIGNWIHHNWTIGGQQDHGIYLQGDDHLVANNVIHDHPDGFGIQAYDKGARYVIVNNTVTNNGHSGIVVGGSGGVSDVIIRNNILANNDSYGVQHDSSCPLSNVVVENNLIFGNGSGTVQGGCSSISSSGNNTGNPLFVNAGNSTTRDLRVQSGSPAINAARADYAMPTAFRGAARDAQPDIGAYEFGMP
jgi:chitodextrinase